MIDVLIALEEQLMRLGVKAALEEAGDCRVRGPLKNWPLRFSYWTPSSKRGTAS